MSATSNAVRAGFAGIDELLGDGDYVDLPGAEITKQPSVHQLQPQSNHVGSGYEELPVAPEDLGTEEEPPFDLYAWMEQNVQEIKADRAAAENASITVQEGVDSLTDLARGMQQAIKAMATAFQGADDERIAKIVSLVLAKQSAPTGTSPTSDVLIDIEKKISTPIKSMLYAAVGVALAEIILSIAKHIF